MGESIPNPHARTRAAARLQRAQRRQRLVVGLSLALAGVILALAESGGGSSGRLPAPGATGHIEQRLVASSIGTLPAPLQDAAAAGLGGHGLVLLGGLDSAQRSTAAITRLNGAATKGAGVLPAVQHDAQAATLDGAAYVFGGGDTASYDHILRYEPASATVSQAGRLPRRSSDVAVGVLAGTAYVVGGYDGARALDTIVAWRPGAPARTVAHLPIGVRYAAVAGIGHRLIIAGGTTSSGASDAILSFDPTTNAVEQIGRLPGARTHASAATLGGLVYVVGGRQGAGGPPTATILSIDPVSGAARPAGQLPQALSDAAVVAVDGRIVVVGGEAGATAVRSIVAIDVQQRRVGGQTPAGASRSAPIDQALSARGFGATLAANPASIPAYDAAARRGGLPGYLLIADRGNNRVLVVNPQGDVVWRYPTAADLAAGRKLRFNDDTFVAPGGKTLIANEEDNAAIVSIGIGDHRLRVLFGQPGVTAGGPSHLNYPDDAYAFADGSFTVADAYNCRILFVRAGEIVRQYGRSGVCRHDPPGYFGAVNGDTPTPGGGVLVSEIPGHWVDSIAADGTLRYAVKAPASYPSDPQPLPHDNVLLADYASPGHVLVMDRFGHVLWRYGPAAGPGRLDHPSLALELPNGDIAVNDDYRHRVVVIDPRTGAIVWQYGHTDKAGTAAGYLNTPDGMDFIPAAPNGQLDWAAVVHP